MKKIKKITKKQIQKLERRNIKKQFKNWSLLVKSRDNHMCIICGKIDILHTHHIIPREKKEFRFDIDNGVTLCPLHHKYSYDISPHKNSLVFYIWLKHHREEQLSRLIEKLKNRETIR